MPNCNEIWKPIEEYEGIYSVSNWGIFRVLSGEKDKVKGMGFSYISTTELEEYRKGINP